MVYFLFVVVVCRISMQHSCDLFRAQCGEQRCYDNTKSASRDNPHLACVLCYWSHLYWSYLFLWNWSYLFFLNGTHSRVADFRIARS